MAGPRWTRRDLVLGVVALLLLCAVALLTRKRRPVAPTRRHRGPRSRLGLFRAGAHPAGGSPGPAGARRRTPRLGAGRHRPVPRIAPDDALGGRPLRAALLPPRRRGADPAGRPRAPAAQDERLARCRRGRSRRGDHLVRVRSRLGGASQRLAGLRRGWSRLSGRGRRPVRSGRRRRRAGAAASRAHPAVRTRDRIDGSRGHHCAAPALPRRARLRNDTGSPGAGGHDRHGGLALAPLPPRPTFTTGRKGAAAGRPRGRVAGLPRGADPGEPGAGERHRRRARHRNAHDCGRAHGGLPPRAAGPQRVAAGAGDDRRAHRAGQPASAAGRTPQEPWPHCPRAARRRAAWPSC